MNCDQFDKSSFDSDAHSQLPYGHDQ